MTTTTIKSFVREPFDLALGQPHQFLISAASVAIVAAEAATLVPFPLNISLAVGAEWAYLRGLISGAGIKSRWSAALNTSAFMLVVLYGALWGFRGFHLIPDTPDPWLAIVLTIVHIGAIGAVTLCSAMLHRAGEAVRLAKESTDKELEEKRRREMQAERDRIDLEMERKRQELAIWEQGMEAKMRLKMRAQNAPAKMRRNALSEPTNADEKKCPKCGAELEQAQWLAARRWGHCATCKEVQSE